MTRENNLDVVERLNLLENERLEKLEQMQKAKETVFTYKPIISKASQEILEGYNRGDIVEINKEWAEMREQRLEWLRTHKLEKELYEETFVPKLNPKTLKIIEKLKEKKKRLRDGMPFEEYLKKRENERQKELLKKREKHLSETAPGRPKISLMSAELVREGSVSDRLYEESFKLNEKKLNYQQRQLREQITYSFQPNISSYNIKRDGSPVFEHLLKKEELSRLKKAEEMERLLEKEKELHHPKINPVSEEIASRLPYSTKERLLQTPKHVAREPSPNWTFHPEINKRSAQIEEERRGRRDTLSRIERLYKQDKMKKDKLKQLRTEFEQKELEECTFNPKTIRVKRDTQPLWQRCKNWEDKRKAKISRERAFVEKKDLEECTFRPWVNTEFRINETSSRHNRSADFSYLDGIEDPLGFDEFVQRQREARILKEQRKSEVFSTDEKWKNEITIPKEFNLGTKRPGAIKSLKKPLSPSELKI
jgi:hypothetical protein